MDTTYTTITLFLTLVFISSSYSELNCKKCLPGNGVARKCITNETLGVIVQDTMCAECLEGTFNLIPTSNGNCTACKTCPEGSYERRPCRPLHDVICKRCDDPDRGYGNEDFLQKCERTTTTIKKIDVKMTTAMSQNNRLTTEEEGSGEPISSGEIGHIDKLDKTTAIDDEYMPVVDKKHPTGITLPSTVAAVEIKEVTEGSSSQIWWIILIVLLVIIGLFFIFVIVRKVRKRKSQNLEKSPPPNSADATVVEMNGTEPSPKTPLKNGTVPDSEPKNPDENTPMVSVQAPQANMAAPPESSAIYRPGRKPKKSALKRAKTFGGSRDFSYIDEDSDDEMVKAVGRPPSVRYKDKKEKRRSNPLALFNKLRPRSFSETAKPPKGNTKKVKVQKQLNTSFDLEASLAKQNTADKY